ncbi:MAG: response regulator [Pleurocapsa sp.]
MTNVVSPEIPNQPIRILLVDDQSFARRFIQQSLKEDLNLNIVGTAQNGQEAIAQVKSLNPDVVLIDLEMPEMDGITATDIIVRQFPNCKVLVLSSHETGEYLQKALRAGAKGYLLKGSPARELANAIHSVHRGYTQLSPGLLERVLTPEVEIVPESTQLEPESSETLVESDWAESTRETVNTLPRVSLRAIFYILLILLLGIIPWAVFAKIDEIGTATGKLEPKGRVVALDAPVNGKVMSVAVREGEQVAVNQQIMELDSELVRAELQQQQQKLLGQENQLNQLEVLQQQQLLALSTQKQQDRAQQYEKSALIEQAEKAIETSKSANQMAKIRYQGAIAKVPRYQKAFDQGALSQDVLSEAQQQALEHQESIKQTASEIAQARSRLAEQQRGLDSLRQTNNLALLNSQEEYKNTETQITTLKGEIAQTQSLISGLEYQMQQRILYSPVAGTIFQIPVKKPGAVVQTGQMIAQIAPQDSPLILRGKMSSRESGFLSVGLPVKVKFDAYPFQDYGIVPGHLTWISPDSRIVQDGNQIAQQTTQPQEYYEVEVELERNYLQNNEKTITLTPGQTAKAEVVIRQRRLADVLLAPFKKLQKGGIQM